MKTGVAYTSVHSRAYVSDCPNGSRIKTQRRVITGIPKRYQSAVALTTCSIEKRVQIVEITEFETHRAVFEGLIAKLEMDNILTFREVKSCC